MAHYFDADPTIPSRPQRVALVLPDFCAELDSDRGVFAAAAVDAGTLALLQAPPPALPSPARDLLDLGCGYGPIALTLAHRYPRATVWALDVNARALALTASNAGELRLDNVRAVRPADVPSSLRFAAMWSNPPIRIGKAALRELLSTWLGRLDGGGCARLVVHKHLGGDSLAAWLEAGGCEVARIGSKRGYRLLHVVRPPEAGSRA